MHTSRGSSHSLMSEGILEWNVFHKKPVELIYSSRILFIYLFSSSFVLKWGMASAIIPLTESDWLEELLFVIWRVSHEQVASCAAIASPLNVPLVLEATLRSLNQLHFCCKYRRLLPNFPAFFATNTGTKHVLAEGYAMDDLPIFWPWVESDEWRGGPSHFVRPCNFWVVEGWKKWKIRAWYSVFNGSVTSRLDWGVLLVRTLIRTALIESSHRIYYFKGEKKKKILKKQNEIVKTNICC